MSEQGWRDFLAAEGGDVWVVLHGGAAAVFRVGSLSEAARLAEPVANISMVLRRALLKAKAAVSASCQLKLASRRRTTGALGCSEV